MFYKNTENTSLFNVQFFYTQAQSIPMQQQISNESNNNKLPPHERAFEWPRQAMREQNWLEAAWRWEVLHKAYPEHPTPFFLSATSYIQVGELQQAEVILKQACMKFPDHLHTLIDTALLSMRKKEWKEAESLLQEARKKHPNQLQTWLKSAECAEAVGNIKKATDYILKACRCTPDQPTAYIQYAELAMRTEQWEEALSRWKDVRNHFPDLPVSYLRAAEAARKLDRPKDARKLILAQQYGTDILEDKPDIQTKHKQHKGLTSIGRQLELIWTKAKFNLHSEVNRNYLSYGWWILEPLLHMIVYYLVFGLLLQRGNENYPVFLLTGLIPWMWFSKAVSASSNSIIAGQQLILQVGLPSLIFPLVSLLQSSLKQIPVFILLFGFLWLLGFPPEEHWQALLPVITVQILLTIAFSCAIAAIIPFIRDLSYLVPTGLMFLMFLSGIFYDYKSISEEWQDIFLLNPIAFLIKSYREILIDHMTPDFITLGWWALGSSVACLILLFVYQRLRYIYPRVLME